MFKFNGNNTTSQICKAVLLLLVFSVSFSARVKPAKIKSYADRVEDVDDMLLQIQTKRQELDILIQQKKILKDPEETRLMIEQINIKLAEIEKLDLKVKKEQKILRYKYPEKYDKSKRDYQVGRDKDNWDTATLNTTGNIDLKLTLIKQKLKKIYGLVPKETRQPASIPQKPKEKFDRIRVSK